MVSQLAFLPFQGDSGADNFLSSYAKSQQIAQARDAAERQKVLNSRQDQAYAQDQRMKQIDQLGAALDGVQDGDAAGFERVKSWAVQNGLLDANEAQRYTVEQLPQIRGLSQQARAMAAERAKAAQDAKEFGLRERQVNASINASNASAEASRALAGQRAAGPAGGINNTTFDNMSGLRKEYQNATKDFGVVSDAYGRIKATANSVTPAGDLSMIYAYMKMLDPGSVVRESEFALAQNAKPLLDRLGISWDAVKSAWEGTKLQPQVRADFLKQAESLYQQQLQQKGQVDEQYNTLASRFGFDPSLVVTGRPGVAAEQSAPTFVRGGAGVFSDQVTPEQQQPASGWSIKRIR